MNTDETNRLLARLAQSEDPWVERKQSFDERDVRKTAVGFANTVSEGQTAVMFIGADNKGRHKGVPDADDMQKKIRGALERCYPPITYQTCVLSVEVEGKPLEVLAILVPFSQNRPHFTGPAYVRRGSETIEASQDVFLELIASQNDTARRILQFKDKKVRLRIRSAHGLWYEFDAWVTRCDAHSAEFRDEMGVHHCFHLNLLAIESNLMHPLLVTAPPRVTEAEHIREMILAWVRFRRVPVKVVGSLPSDWLVDQICANPILVLPVVAALANGSNDLSLRLLHLQVRFAISKVAKSLPRVQKYRLLETEYHQRMQGKHWSSQTCVIGAAVGATVKFAMSLEEAEEFLRFLAQNIPGVRQSDWNTLWNALLWELKL